MRFMLTASFVLGLASPALGQVAPLNAAGMTFGHVHLNVAEIDVHRELWVDGYGGELVQKGPLTAIKFPDMLIVFTERAPTGGSQGTVMDHFGFKVRSLADALDIWRQAGYEVQSEFTGAEGFPNAYLMGPDSVRVEFQEDPTLDKPIIGYHVHFFTPDYRELLDWYVEIFGLERFERGSIATTANAPGMNLSFGGSRTDPVASQGRAIDHIGFEYQDLESVVRELEARGVVFEGPVRDIPSIGLKIAFFTDPAGVRVELTEGLVEY
ncbi:MAG: VOC family protein [Gemmatimonadota bacterium]